MIRSLKSSITIFEDLSNEIIYEIFEYLDFFHIYEAFYNLNIRFLKLLTYSTLPLKINISTISKSTFQYYYTNIIIPNQHRIKLLRLLNPLIIKIIFFSPDIISHFTQLETLIFGNIQSKYLENLLCYLDTLPRLFSLTIIHNDIVENFNNLCRQIFCLPMLKYCKLSLEGSLTFEPLLISTNKGSSIEHLVITNTFHLDQLNALLSYVPHLRRFSLHDLHRSRNQETQTCSIKLNNLTHMDLKTTITFDELELTMIKNFFHQVQVLYISTNSDIAYLDANRWKRLILSYIPQLRIFDFQHRNMIENSNNNNYDNMINRFYSSFWYEHKWFFVHHFYKKQNVNEIIFYSINPYRRKEYTLYEQLNTNIPSYLHKNDVNSVDHVNIHGEKATKNCLSYFSKAMKLTLSHSFAESRIWLGLILNHIVPLKQLTTLIIDCGDF
ncbi:unnamed protein product [Rotaria sp. Silwood1]|nr:unnamed protein product [Rotaria sp. Silwood1]